MAMAMAMAIAMAITIAERSNNNSDSDNRAKLLGFGNTRILIRIRTSILGNYCILGIPEIEDT